jgi:hypothetical protein
MTNNSHAAPSGGVVILAMTQTDIEVAQAEVWQRLNLLALSAEVTTAIESSDANSALRFCLHATSAQTLAPEYNTLTLCARRNLAPIDNADDLEREIWLSMLLGAARFEFPSYAELQSAVRIRMNIVTAARNTTLAFDTEAAERPDCWIYSEDTGFTIRPGHSLVAALQMATQPGPSGRCYSFSCYRATEYVILLGIAQELEYRNPDLYDQLQTHWQQRAIMSGQFHEVFLREYGSMSAPLPPKYYVPGDRVWFRNPDAHSSDVTGYEGSWVIYLGNGEFTNFWKRDQPYTLTSKCVELYHWRHATYRDDAGELQMDEQIVEQRVQASLQDEAEVEQILATMLKLREGQGVYRDGGCIDTSREYPRWVCPVTSDLLLPAL